MTREQVYHAEMLALMVGVSVHAHRVERTPVRVQGVLVGYTQMTIGVPGRLLATVSGSFAEDDWIVGVGTNYNQAEIDLLGRLGAV